MAQCLGHLSSNDSNGSRESDGTSSSEPCFVVRVDLLAWSGDGVIAIEDIVNGHHGPIDDFPHALVLWNRCAYRMVENLHLEECWIASRRQRS